MSPGFLTRVPLSAESLVSRVTAPERGAVATFVGLVRDHHEGRAVAALEYTAYESMADRVCRDLITETETRWPVRAALSHRLGPLVVGDAAVVIAVAAAHRDEAFAACRFLIEELKRRVPIWKRETYADGTELWVNPAQGAESREQEAGNPK